MYRTALVITSCFAIISIGYSACSTAHKIDGWYEIAENDNSIVGKPYFMVADFESVELKEQVHIVDGETIHQYLIQGRIKNDKLEEWADSPKH